MFDYSLIRRVTNDSHDLIIAILGNDNRRFSFLHMNVESFDDVNGVGKVPKISEKIHDSISDFSEDWLPIDI